MLDDYVKQTIKARFKCSEGHVWEARPNNVLSGKGCPVCGRRSMAEKQTLSIETIQSRLKQRNIQLIDGYVNTQTKATFKCENGHTWQATTNSVMSGRSCPHCFTGNHPLSKEIINKRLKDRSIELLGDYYGAHVSTLFKCSEGHTWEARPSNVLNGRNCPHCAKQFPLSKAVVNNRISKRSIKLVGDYSNNFNKTTFRCSEGHEWEASPANVLAGTGCPQCAGNIKLTKEEVNDRIADRGIKLLGDYINNSSVTLFTCKKGHMWNTAPAVVLSGSGCPECADSTSDNDVFYVWTTDKTIVEEVVTNKQIVKLGVTSESRGMMRLKEVGWAWGVKPVVIAMVKTKVPATWIEALAGCIGESISSKYSERDGWTEFRIVDQSELAQILSIANQAKERAIVWNTSIDLSNTKPFDQLILDFE